ncbi:hypothetical protein BGZ98_008854 [Dissophora globulifera]|nr:hypothetical protein BGZ98_008854 [Dissophora globulifera]
MSSRTLDAATLRALDALFAPSPSAAASSRPLKPTTSTHRQQPPPQQQQQPSPPNRRDTLAHPQPPFVRVRHPDESPGYEDTTDGYDDFDDSDDDDDDEDGDNERGEVRDRNGNFDDATLDAIASSTKEFSALFKIQNQVRQQQQQQQQQQLQQQLQQQQLLQRQQHLKQRLQRHHEKQQQELSADRKQSQQQQKQQPQGPHQQQQHQQRRRPNELQQQQYRQLRKLQQLQESENDEAEEEDSDRDHRTHIDSELHKTDRAFPSELPNPFQASAVEATTTAAAASSSSSSQPRKYNKSKTKSTLPPLTPYGAASSSTPPKRQYKKTILRQQAALLAAQIQDENQTRNSEATRRTMARSGVSRYLRALKSRLAYAQYKVEQGLEEQPLHLVSELFEEELNESGGSDSALVASSTRLSKLQTLNLSTMTASPTDKDANEPKSLTITTTSTSLNRRPSSSSIASVTRKSSVDHENPRIIREDHVQHTVALRSPTKTSLGASKTALSEDSESDNAAADGFKLSASLSTIPSTYEELQLQQRRQLEELQRSQQKQLKELQRIQREQQLAMQAAHAEKATRQRLSAASNSHSHSRMPPGKPVRVADKENRDPSLSVSLSDFESEESRRPKLESVSREPSEQRSLQATGKRLSNPVQDKDRLREQLQKQQRRQSQQHQLQLNQQKEEELIRRQRQLEQQQMQQNRRKQLLLQLQEQQLQEQTQRDRRSRHGENSTALSKHQQQQHHSRPPSSSLSRQPITIFNDSAKLSSSVARPLVQAAAPKKKKPLNPVQKAPSTENILASVGATVRHTNMLRSNLVISAASPALATAKSALLGSKRIHSVFEDKENQAPPRSSQLKAGRHSSVLDDSDVVAMLPHSPVKVYKRQRPTSGGALSTPMPSVASVKPVSLPSPIPISTTANDNKKIQTLSASKAVETPVAVAASSSLDLANTRNSTNFAAALLSSSPDLTPHLLPTDASDEQSSGDLLSCFEQWMSDLGNEEVTGFTTNQDIQHLQQPAFDFTAAAAAAATAFGIMDERSEVAATEDGAGPTEVQSELDNETELDESEIDQLLYSEVGEDYGIIGAGYGNHGLDYASTPGSEMGTQDFASDPATADLYDWFPADTIQNTATMTATAVASSSSTSFGTAGSGSGPVHGTAEQQLSFLSSDPTLSSPAAELSQGLELGLDFDATGDPLWLQEELRLQQQQHQQHREQLRRAQRQQQQQQQESEGAAAASLQSEDGANSRSGTPQLDSTTSTLLSSSSFSDMLSPATLLAQVHTPSSSHYIPMGPGGQPVMPLDFAEQKESLGNSNANSEQAMLSQPLSSSVGCL